MRALTRDLSDFEGPFDDNEVLIAATRQELAGLANSIGEALQALDDWEFDTRVGLLPSEARAVRDQIKEMLRSAFRPD